MHITGKHEPFIRCCFNVWAYVYHQLCDPPIPDKVMFSFFMLTDNHWTEMFWKCKFYVVRYIFNPHNVDDTRHISVDDTYWSRTSLMAIVWHHVKRKCVLYIIFITTVYTAHMIWGRYRIFAGYSDTGTSEKWYMVTPSAPLNIFLDDIILTYYSFHISQKCQQQ